MPGLPTINAIWIGPELGTLHAACLRSFLNNGHEVKLHCYDSPRDVPGGIELADANVLLPKDQIIVHRKTGSMALFSDLLRYEILGAGLGLYVDCDVFCLRPIQDADYIFGWESSTSIATGILKLPTNCPVLDELRALKNKRGKDLPWLNKRRPASWKARIAHRLVANKRPDRLENLRWGSVGPVAFTYYVKKYGLEHLASPIDRFYPMHLDHLPLLFDPQVELNTLVTPRSDTLHLYNSNFWRLSSTNIVTGSPACQLIRATAPS
jgi:hypothetical protein